MQLDTEKKETGTKEGMEEEGERVTEKGEDNQKGARRNKV